MTLETTYAAKDSGSFDAERIAAVTTAAKEVTERYGREYWLRCVAEDKQPDELMLALAESGLLGIGLPEEFGGSGGGIFEEAALIDTMARAGLPPQLLIVLPAFARRMVASYGTPVQRERFVTPTLSGRQTTAFAITEADAGTNSFAMRTTAVRDGDEWVINGQKVFISGAGEAAQMLLVAKTGETVPGRADLSLFMMDLPQAGITMTPMKIAGLLPERQYVVYFDDVRLPADALVGTEGDGARNMFHALNPERILAAVAAIGLGHFILAKGVEYVKTRSPFGRPTGSYQAVQHPLARAWVQLETAREVVMQAATEYDAGSRSGLKPNMAKLLASEAAHYAADVTVQVHGGSAFDADTDVFTIYELIRHQRIAPISNEMVLNFIAEKALGLPKSY